MKKKIILISCLVGIVALIVVVYFYLNKHGKRPTNIATTVAKKGEFLIVVSEVGKLDAAKSVNITANTQGKIVKMVPEGTAVKKGDPVVWLDTTEIEKQIKDLEANLKSEEANYQKTEENERLNLYQNDMSVKSAKSQLANAQAELESARTKLARTQRLFDAQLTPETALEEAKLAVLGAELAVQNAEIALAKAEETRKSGEISSKINLQQAKASVAEAQRRLQQYQDQLKDATLTAPSDGIVVYSTNWRGGTFGKVQEGDQVWPRMNIMTIPDLSKMVAIVQVDEVDISRIKNGQEAIIHVDALPDLVLKGTVSRIATLAVDKGAGDAPFWMQREASGVKVFEVVVDVEPSGASNDLRPGMTVKVDIIIDRFTNVVTVPLETVFEYKDKKVVYVMSSKVPVRREVILGKNDGNYVIIEKGLNGGETICLRDPTKELKEPGLPKKLESQPSPSQMGSAPTGMPTGSPVGPPPGIPGGRRGGGGRER
ncbi:MAG: efflux RND transporter periplasmic adaptor subunit [bacterium]|nr:efflux RND transporter periplasmic adaptor subunit [bacterium]